MILEAREREIKTLVIAGDFLNFDSLSQYDPKQQEAGLEREINEAVGVMRILLETFKDIYYIWGNHDARLHKALSYKLQFRHAMRLVFGDLGSAAIDRITFSNLDHCYVQGASGGVPWYVCHPASYSRVPLSQGRRLAAKHGMSVVTAHSHHCAMGPAENGKHIVVEAGGFFDAESTAYLQRSSTFPTWVPGYLILDERGKPTLRSPLYD
jgi:predicted phosphodiesterase